MTEITKLEYRTTDDTTALALGGINVRGKHGWEAVIEREGDRLLLSRLDGEDRWHVDGRIPPGTSMPTFYNGWGSRCTIPSYPDPQTAALLDTAVTTPGFLWAHRQKYMKGND
jgi:hypothetical protein